MSATPRGGGAVFVVLTLLGLALYQTWTRSFVSTQLAAYAAGALLLALVSFVDDARGLPVPARLAAQCMAAAVAIWGFSSSVSPQPSSFVPLTLTFVWIVGLTNAYNFMDGIDGLAGSQAVVAGLGWLILGGSTGHVGLAFWGAMVAGSAAGFLPHNWAPARLFMGDVGSAFLGYTFAVMPLLIAEEAPRLAAAGILPLWPFLLDAGFTFVRRLVRGENVLAAHRSHLYQQMVIAGASHVRVAVLYAALSIAGLGLAVLLGLGAARS